MKKNLNALESAYNPQTQKTFEGALEAFFSTECPQLGGFRTRQVLVKSVIDMVNKFYPKTTHMKPGQVVWPTVHKDEKSSYGKSIQNTGLTTVVLDLVRPEDAKDRAKGKNLRTMKKEAVARLCKQAYEQGGCITSAELSILLKVSATTIGKYIKEWELNNKEVLPRRGSIHDIGPTLTHKKIIIEKLFLEQKTVPEVSRETYHSLASIQRYISTFKQILLCKKKGMSIEEIGYVIKRTRRLVEEYEKIIEEFKEKNYVLEKLMKFDTPAEAKFSSAGKENLAVKN